VWIVAVSLDFRRSGASEPLRGVGVDRRLARHHLVSDFLSACSIVE